MVLIERRTLASINEVGMEQLDIRLLGSMQLLRGDRPLTNFASDKVRALFVYLVIEAAHPHQRRKLATLLWPEIPETNALASLRHALSNLRKVIGDRAAQPPYLITTPQTIQLNRDSEVKVDVNLFEEYCALAQKNPLDFQSLSIAADLYMDRFLEGFSISDSVPFEEWMVIKRERFDQLAFQVFHKLANYYEIIGDYQSAIAFAQRQIGLDPWREEAHRLMMRCLYYSGQRSAAIAQYDKCCKALASDLNIEPSSDTVKLFEAIRDKNLPLPPSPPAFCLPAPNIPLARPIFVNRQEPLDRMQSALKKVLEGQGQVLLVTGSAGQGKSVLVREFIDQALESQPNLAAASGNSHAYFGSGDPFLPFREILEMLTGQIEHFWEAGTISHDHARRMWRLTAPSAQILVQHGSELIETFVSGASLLQRVSYILREEPSWVSQLSKLVDRKNRPPLLKEALFQQYCRVVIELSHHVPLIIFVDDLQWADQSSLELFFHLSRQISPAPILLLGAFRPVESSSSMKESSKTLADMVNELRIHGGDILIDLDTYTDICFIDDYLDQAPNALGEDFRHHLHQYTRSHPLYTVEMLFDMKKRGDLTKNEAGEWIAADSLNWDHVPPRIEAAIKESLIHLPSVLLDMLKIASVEGERFTAEVLANVKGIDEEQALFSLREELDQQFRLVKADSSRMVNGNRLTRYRFRHILFQKYLYGQLDGVERERLHEQVGEAIENCYAGGIEELSLPLAIHFELAGLIDKAVYYYEAAARHANRFSSYEDAISHFEKALRLLGKKPETQARNKQELDLRVALSAPLMFSHGFASDVVGANNDRMVTLLKLVSSDINMFPLYHAISSYYMMRAHYPIALDLLQEAEHLAQQGEEELPFRLIDWGVGFTNLWLGNLKEALTGLDKMVEFFDPILHGKLHKIFGIDPGVACHLWSSWALWLLGFPEKALTRGQQAIDLSNLLGDPANQIFAFDIVGMLHLLMRRKDEVSELLKNYNYELEKNPAPLYIADYTFLEGFFHVHNGTLEEGIEQMTSGIEGYKAIGTRSQLSIRMTALAETYLRNKQWDQAAQVLKQVEDFIEETEERFFQAEAIRLKGELLTHHRNLKDAEACYLSALQVARAQKANTLELRTATSLARLWEGQGRNAEAYQILAEVYNWFTEGFDTLDLKEARELLVKLAQKIEKSSISST
jgi:DNA-binding SARP family transcriptional activator